MRKPKRPGGVTAIAIINIVLGSLGMLLGLCGIIGLVMMKDMMQQGGPLAQLQEVQDALAKEVPLYNLMQILGIAVLVILSVAMLVTGIGLLSVQNWARVWSILFSVFAIGWECWEAAYQTIFVKPATKRFALLNPPGMEVLTTILQFGLWILFIGYALVVIYVLTRPHVRAIYTGTATYEDEGDRYGDEDDRQRRRDPYPDDDDGWPQRRPPQRSDGYDEHVQ